MIKIFNLVTELIIKIVSLSFASIIFLYVISSKESWIYIVFAVPLVMINYILSKKFPNGFNTWGQYKHPYDIFFVAPVSIIIISTAFIVYVFNYFNPLANEIWLSALQILPALYDIAGREVFVFSYSIILVILMVLVPFIIFRKIFKLIKKRDHKFGEYKKQAFLFYICGSFLIFSFFIILLNFLIVNKIIENSVGVITFIVGFIPIHWFYEIFIGSLLKRKKEKKLEPNI